MPTAVGDPAPPVPPTFPARLAAALAPREALRLRPFKPSAFFCLCAALVTALPALALILAGHRELAGYAAFGGFPFLCTRDMPYLARIRRTAGLGLGITACVAAGTATSWSGSAAVLLTGMGLVMGAAVYVCARLRVTGPGAVLFLFAYAVPAVVPGSAGPDVLRHAAITLAGLVFACASTAVGLLFHPQRPQRRAVAVALRATADVLDSSTKSPHAAVNAVVAARRVIKHSRGPEELHTLLDHAWVELTRPRPDSAEADGLRATAEALLSRRRHADLSGPRRQSDSTTGSATDCKTGSGSDTGSDFDPAWAEAAAGHAWPQPTRRTLSLLPHAVRAAVGTSLAGYLAWALGLGHDYWAAIGAAAVLQGSTARVTTHRAVQRVLGTMLGLFLTAALLAFDPGPAIIILMVAAMQFGTEFVIGRNYALGVTFLTPMSVLLGQIAVHADTGGLLWDRILATVLGVAVTLPVALLITHNQAAKDLDSALSQVNKATNGSDAPRSPQERQAATAELAYAVAALREADDAARGELWPVRVESGQVAQAEQRAFHQLRRLRHTTTTGTANGTTPGEPARDVRVPTA